MEKVLRSTVKIVLFIFLGGIVIASCSEPKEVEKITFLEKRVFTAEDSIVDLYRRTQGEAHGGTFFSRADTTNQYGIGTVYAINDTSVNKDLRVKMNLWIRSNQVSPACVYAIALHDGDKIVSWNEIKLDRFVNEPNKWINVVDSVTITGNFIDKPGLIVKTFTYNTQKQVVFDADDLELNFYSVKKEVVE